MYWFLICLQAFSASTPGVFEPSSPERLLPLYEQHLINLESREGTSRADVAAALSNAGRFAEVAGRADVALAQYRRALALAEDPATRGELLERLAEVSAPAERFELLEVAIEERRKAGPTRGLAALYRKTAELAAARGDREESLARYRAAVAVAEHAGEQTGLASALVDLGYAFEQGERFAEAGGYYRRALAIQEKALGRSHPEVAITLNNLAGVTGAQRDLRSAEQMLRRALGILESSLGPYHTRVAVCLGNLADLLAATDRERLARPLYRRALEAYRRLGDREGAAEMERALSELR
jgi:tetratricopeptide (TPR) repeat protein